MHSGAHAARLSERQDDRLRQHLVSLDAIDGVYHRCSILKNYIYQVYILVLAYLFKLNEMAKCGRGRDTVGFLLLRRRHRRHKDVRQKAQSQVGYLI